MGCFGKNKVLVPVLFEMCLKREALRATAWQSRFREQGTLNREHIGGFLDFFYYCMTFWKWYNCRFEQCATEPNTSVFY